MKLEALQQDRSYHIYNRGINGTNIFASDRNKVYFLQLYKMYVSQHVTTFAYCLLGNHFHIALRLNSEPKVVTQGFSNLFNAYAKAFNIDQNRTGSLFEKHFKRIELTSEKYLQQLIIYIHLNPEVHFGLDHKEFKFSSYKSFLSDDLNIVNREETLALFQDKDNYIKMHNSIAPKVNEHLTFE